MCVHACLLHFVVVGCFDVALCLPSHRHPHASWVFLSVSFVFSQAPQQAPSRRERQERRTPLQYVRRSTRTHLSNTQGRRSGATERTPTCSAPERERERERESRMRETRSNTSNGSKTTTRQDNDNSSERTNCQEETARGKDAPHPNPCTGKQK